MGGGLHRRVGWRHFRASLLNRAQRCSPFRSVVIVANYNGGYIYRYFILNNFVWRPCASFLGLSTLFKVTIFLIAFLYFHYLRDSEIGFEFDTVHHLHHTIDMHNGSENSTERHYFSKCTLILTKDLPFTCWGFLPLESSSCAAQQASSFYLEGSDI